MDTDTRSAAGAPLPPAEMNNLLERLLDEAEGGGREREAEASPPAELPVSAPLPPPASAGMGGLGALLSNPALLSVLPTLAENLSPLLGAMSRGTGSAPTATRPHTVDRHTALLCAVKPYLSPRRQEAAETVIRLCRIWDALERSGISLSGVLAGSDKGSPAGTDTATGENKEVT